MPFSAFKLNTGETGYVDITGRAATFSGTPVFAPPILAGTNKSLSVVGNTPYNITTSLFRKGNEDQPFTLVAWFAPTVFTSGVMSILSHSGIYDGLMFDGDNIKFRIKSSLGNFLETSWPVPDRAEAYMAAGVYNNQKIQLLINGVVVDEEDVTAEFRTWATEPFANLYLGQASSTTYRASADGLAVFASALTPTQIMDMYLDGRDVIPTIDAVGALGGSYWTGVDRKISLQRTWAGDEWQNGTLTNASATDGTLKPQNDSLTNLSMPGTWRGVLELNATELTSAGGVRLEWEGDGSFTVATSPDNGGVWTTAVNGRNVINTFGLNTTTTPFLDIRITFTGGLANDISVVRSLTATVFSDAIITGADTSRTLTVTNLVTSGLEYNEPIERNMSTGIDFYGGTATLSADTSGTARNVATTEVWVRQRGVVSGAGGYIFDTRAGGGTAFMWIPVATGLLSWAGLAAVYINGVLTSSGTYTMKQNEWVHIVIVFTTPLNTPIVYAGGLIDGQFSLISTYPTALTATQALALYQSYGKVPLSRIDDAGVIQLSEPATPVIAYAYNWESQNA